MTITSTASAGADLDMIETHVLGKLLPPLNLDKSFGPSRTTVVGTDEPVLAYNHIVEASRVAVLKLSTDILLIKPNPGNFNDVLHNAPKPERDRTAVAGPWSGSLLFR